MGSTSNRCTSRRRWQSSRICKSIRSHQHGVWNRITSYTSWNRCNANTPLKRRFWSSLFILYFFSYLLSSIAGRICFDNKICFLNTLKCLINIRQNVSKLHNILIQIDFCHRRSIYLLSIFRQNITQLTSFFHERHCLNISTRCGLRMFEDISQSFIFSL